LIVIGGKVILEIKFLGDVRFYLVRFLEIWCSLKKSVSTLSQAGYSFSSIVFLKGYLARKKTYYLYKVFLITEILIKLIDLDEHIIRFLLTQFISISAFHDITY
jgi:hypothetical protein